jgi:hypothetical protein
MNLLEALFGKGKHVGCLFHRKQAIFKYLKEKCDLGNSTSLEAAMKVGCLDILCGLPTCNVLKYGIPFIRSFIEYDIPTWELDLVGNSNFWFRFLGPPSEAEFQFCFQF